MRFFITFAFRQEQNGIPVKVLFESLSMGHSSNVGSLPLRSICGEKMEGEHETVLEISPFERKYLSTSFLFARGSLTFFIDDGPKAALDLELPEEDSSSLFLETSQTFCWKSQPHSAEMPRQVSVSDVHAMVVLEAAFWGLWDFRNGHCVMWLLHFYWCFCCYFSCAWYLILIEIWIEYCRIHHL